ncbi:transporter substrate-binding domain-containing protein [Shewanella algae]|uniref:ATP-binding protein n=1 Tax=Shewanella algae TaxID=38313 RepID=UPI001AAC6260|nr:transporter substrate-binding domain-containing protein [Shewanella algae]MBO2676979.1 transporter substrate-binding domain-containing protein [Shewanella algae]
MSAAPLSRVLYLIMVSLFIVSQSIKADTAHSLTLFGHSTIGDVNVQLSDDQWSWLGERKILRVGISTPDYPPFDMTMDGSSDFYEGLSADYLKILSDALKVKIELHFFSSRQSAIAAVKAGELDLLTTANRYEEFYNLKLSREYILNLPVLYVSEKYQTTGSPSRIAMAYDYLPDSEVRKLFPMAELINYPSRQQAVAAAAFGQADAVVIDLTSANYLVNKNFSNKLILKNILPIDTKGISFALHPNNQALIEIVNSVLDQLPESEHWAIKKRWSGGGLTIPGKTHRLELTEEEQAWLKKHHPVKVIVNKFNAPMSYFDTNRHLHGYLADILDVIKLYIGMEIVVLKAQDVDDMEKYLIHNIADFAVLSPSEIRRKNLLFSKEFARTPYALITRKHSNTPLLKQELTVALPYAHIANEVVNEVLPQAKITHVGNYLDAMDAIIKGTVDSTIAPLALADFYSGHYFGNQLQVESLLHGISPATAAFTTNKSNPELISILNKVLAAIPADELQTIENRWRVNAVPGQETWRDYKYTIYAITIASVLLILASMVWAWFTRGHYIKRLNAKRELKEQLVFMQEVVDSIPHPIYVRDLNRRLILCNQNYLKVFKASREDVLHKTTLEGINRVDEVNEIDLEYQLALTENRAFYRDRKMHIDGQSVDIYHWFQPFKDEQGEVRGIVGGWIDVSERVKLMEQLTQAKDMADGASKAKTQFLATMSHEIRTPMNAIIGLLELSLKRAQDNQFDFNSIRVAYDSAKGLLDLIGDILDVVRIEAGQLSLNPVQVELKQTLDSVIRIFDGIAIQKGLTLTLEFNPELPKYAQLDPLRVKQILSNLIGNAIKFTDQGHIKVTAQKELDAEGTAQLLLRVADTGIGIPIKEQQKLFRPFAQVHNGAHNKGGTGLGLMICRSLCDMMGGTLSMMSEPGQGTCLSMRIPLLAAETHLFGENKVNSTADVIPSIQAQHVLIVDDHPANRLLLSQQLRYLGHTVEEANDGKEALQLFSQHSYKIVITDCNMPEMDGYELSRRLRQLEQNQNLSPAVLLGYTANAQLEAKRACIEAGMNDCLFKPISLEELQQKLNSFRNQLNQEGPRQSFLSSSLDKLTGGNKQLTEQLLQELLSANEADLARLQSAVHNCELDEAKSVAHKIKGAAKIIAATAIVTLCEQLEQSETTENASVHLAKLTVAITRLASEIKEFLASGN